MKKQFFTLVCLLINAQGLCAQESGCLDLDTAIERAFDASPLLSIAQAEVGIASAEVCQAGMRPNPEFIFEYNGDAAFQNQVDQPEIQYGLSQEIEIVGKRRMRRITAAALKYRTEWELELAGIELCRSVTQAFISAFGAQEKMGLARANLEVSQQIVGATTEKIRAGRISPTYKSRAILVAAASERALSRVLRDYNNAKQDLSAFWGDCRPDFDCLTFALYELAPLPPAPDPCTECVDHALVALWDAEIDAARNNITLQKLNGVPNVSLNAGLSHEGRKFDKTSAFFGISFPIPIFDSNQAGVAKAYHEQHRAEENRRRALITYQSRVINTYNELKIAYDTAHRFMGEILSLARHELAVAEEGFKQGKLDYHELLESKRTFIEVNEEVIDALIEYHIKRAEYTSLENKNVISEETECVF